MNVNKNFLVLLTTVVLMLHATSGEDMKVCCVKWESLPPDSVLVIYCVKTNGEIISCYKKDQSTKTENGTASCQLRGVDVQDQVEYKCYNKTDGRPIPSPFTIVADDSINGSQAETPTPTTPTSSSASVSASKNRTSPGDGETPSKSTGVIAVVLVLVLVVDVDLVLVLVVVVVVDLVLVVVLVVFLAVSCYKKRGQRRNNQADAENGTEMEDLNRPPQPPGSTECLP